MYESPTPPPEALAFFAAASWSVSEPAPQLPLCATFLTVRRSMHLECVPSWASYFPSKMSLFVSSSS